MTSHSTHDLIVQSYFWSAPADGNFPAFCDVVCLIGQISRQTKVCNLFHQHKRLVYEIQQMCKHSDYDHVDKSILVYITVCPIFTKDSPCVIKVSRQVCVCWSLSVSSEFVCLSVYMPLCRPALFVSVCIQ